ncbi:hypothetical protein [Embleya sp. NBC_00896]|uniref:hypothetical protein n=1 Tax=Embleya sp. NBC_00896 TaxID=2975961 RepID=UPI0038704933|nr:hypothetical protein OG928_04730 [Embleya sp. NBC_00896]
MPHDPLPDYASILREVREVRRVGVVRLRDVELPSLEGEAAALEPDSSPYGEVERLLRLAVSRIGGGMLQEAAEYCLGLAPNTRDWQGADRRKRAAQVYQVSVERFRKHHEVMILGQVAEQVLRLADRSAGERDAPHAASGVGHHTFEVAVGRERIVSVSVHDHPVDLLRDVDVVVSPTNTYFALPEAYKSSVSASLRRAGALRGPTGELVEDLIHDELNRWTARHGAPGRAVLPGTVATTGAGALAKQGIRRIYHAAIAVPRAGTNDYDVLPADVTRACARALDALAEEHERFDPPLRSICFPLLGSGRGGLRPEDSAAAVWAAIEADLARGAHWEIHLAVLGSAGANAVERLLAGKGGGG